MILHLLKILTKSIILLHGFVKARLSSEVGMLGLDKMEEKLQKNIIETC